MISETHRSLLRQYAKDDAAYANLLSLFAQVHEDASTLRQTFQHELPFLEHAPSSIVITDAIAHDNPVIFVNSQFEIDTGFSRDDVMGKNLRLLQADDTDQPEIKIMGDAIENEESCQVTLRNYRKDGTLFWNEVYISPIRDETGVVRYFIGVQNDVTEKVNLINDAYDEVETRLRVSEAHYRQLVENSLDAIASHTPDGRFIYANEPQSKLTGYSLEELLKMSVKDVTKLVHPDDLEFTQTEGHQAILDGKSMIKIQYRLVHKLGHHIWVENFSVPLYNRDGELEQILSTSRDISMQKEAEHALKTHIQRSQALLEAIPDLMFRLDRNGRYLDYQAKPSDLYVAPEALLGNTIKQILPSEVAELTMANIQLALETGTMQTFEYRLNIPERGLRDYEVRMVPSGDNEVTTIVRDVTELKKVQSALQKSEERARKLIEAIPDLIFRLSADGVYLDYEAKEADLYYRSDTLIGKTVADTLPPEFAEQSMYYINLAIETQEMQTFEYQMYMPGRGMLDYESRIVPIDDDEVISYVRDITEAKRHQQRKLELTLEKERRRLLTEFIRNAAHEFRTPLTSINASAHIMVQTDDKLRQRSKAEQIENQITRLTHLLDMLLLMMRLSNDDTILRKPMDLETFRQAMCQLLHKKNMDRHTIICQSEPDLPEIMGNEDLLTEAILQLFDNASRFTPPGGTITLGMYRHNGHVLIEIHDTGVGISEEAMPHVFKTFWRLDDAHTTPGFGLGLTIAKEIINFHDGTITVVSELGSGTAIRILLPVVEMAPQ